MNLHRFLKNWVLPPMIYRSIGQSHFEFNNIKSEQIKILAHNRRFHNKYKNKRGFVLGNGQSLNNIDLSLLSNEVTITMNRFDRNPILKKWQPTFHCMLDGGNVFAATPSLVNELKNAYNGISPKESFFFNLTTKPFIEQFVKNDKTNLHYVKTDVDISTLLNIEKNWDLTGKIPGGWNTLVLGIEIAIYLGCNPIYLLGVDHDWLAHRGYDKHFYEVDEIDQHLGKTPYTDLIVATLRQFKGYKTIREYTKSRNIQIINATTGSYLDVFPQTNYQDLFGASE